MQMLRFADMHAFIHWYLCTNRPTHTYLHAHTHARTHTHTHL